MACKTAYQTLINDSQRRQYDQTLDVSFCWPCLTATPACCASSYYDQRLSLLLNSNNVSSDQLSLERRLSGQLFLNESQCAARVWRHRLGLCWGCIQEDDWGIAKETKADRRRVLWVWRLFQGKHIYILSDPIHSMTLAVLRSNAVCLLKLGITSRIWRKLPQMALRRYKVYSGWVLELSPLCTLIEQTLRHRNCAVIILLPGKFLLSAERIRKRSFESH